MIVEWSAAATVEFEQIAEFLAEISKSAAASFEKNVRAATMRLAVFPESGRISAGEPGTRELVIGRYVIQYVVATDRVVIAAIRHGARGRDVPDPDQVHEESAEYDLTTA